MKWLQTLQDDMSATGAILVILVLVVASLIAVLIQRRHTQEVLAGFLSDFERLVAGWDKDADPSTGGPVWEALSRNVLFRGRDDRLVVKDATLTELKSLGGVLLSRGRFGWVLRLIGDNLTAIALVLTFALLGVVLVDSVVEALKASGDDQTNHLGSAVAMMGAKFFVSAVGLVGSVVVHFVIKNAQGTIARAFDSAAPTLARHIEELSTYQARTQAQSLDSMEALRGELKEVGREWGSQLRKLESISVTVSGIGEEVTTHFANFIKESVAERICEAVVDLRNNSEQVAQTMQQQLAASFAGALQSEMSRLEQGLGGVQRAVEGQSQSDIERLLEKLSDTVTGGFKSESANMSDQLARFGEILPRLQSQIETMGTAMSTNAERYGEKNQQAIDALTARMGELLGHFDEARAGMNAAVSQLATAGTEAATKVSEATQGQVDGFAQVLAANAEKWNQQSHQALGQVGERVGALLVTLDSSRSGMDEVVDRLSQVTLGLARTMQQEGEGHARAMSDQVAALQRAANDGASMVNERTAAFDRSMANAQAHLQTSTKALNDSIASISSLLKQAASTQDKTHLSLSQFGDAATKLSDAAKRIDASLAKQALVLEREEQLLVAQRDAVDKLEPALAQVFKTYESGLERQSAHLSASWTKLAEKTQKIVGTASDEFSESVQDLAKSLDDFRKAMRPGQRS